MLGLNCVTSFYVRFKPLYDEISIGRNPVTNLKNYLLRLQSGNLPRQIFSQCDSRIVRLDTADSSCHCKMYSDGIGMQKQVSQTHIQLCNNIIKLCQCLSNNFQHQKFFPPFLKCKILAITFQWTGLTCSLLQSLVEQFSIPLVAKMSERS